MPPPLAPHGMCLKILNERSTKDGRGSVNKPLKFLDQDYEFLHKYCIDKRLRFIDEMFPPDLRSIGQGLLPEKLMTQVEWIRPTKLLSDPQFVVDGLSRFDYAQGTILGNCWFLASVGALTFQEHVLFQVIPTGQSFNHNYAGIFHFRFWRFGEWYDVVIDDKLPTIDGKLIFVCSKTHNEFWPALLEKAYAKVCGSYADMHSGHISEALLDFTGGVHIQHQLNTAPADLWEMIHRAAKLKALMGCSTPNGDTREKKLPNGLVLGHAYTVTGASQVMSGGNPVQLVRVLNPWGGTEWNGNWSDKSPLWDTVSEEDRKKRLIAENGEFWMSMKDFKESFEYMDICCLCPDFLDGVSQFHWSSKYHEGIWVVGSTAGGCLNYKETFWTNPQFWLKINRADGDSDGRNNILVSLIQKPDKRNRRFVSVHCIGFRVFAVPPEMRSVGKLGTEFFYSRSPVASSGDYLNVRQVMKFFRLEAGDYVIVPSTFDPNKSTSFILSVICKNEIHIERDTERTEKGFLVDLTEVDYTEKELKNMKVSLFRQYSDQYKDVDAVQLQRLLHENLLGGNAKISEGFGLDTCRSMIAMSDSSVTGRLDGSEFIRLWNRILCYKDIFYSLDSSKDGFLSLKELLPALEKTGMNISEDILSLMAVRYGGASEEISLEGFICLVMRLHCMANIFQRLSDGKRINLDESEWIELTMYS